MRNRHSACKIWYGFFEIKWIYEKAYFEMDWFWCFWVGFQLSDVKVVNVRVIIIQDDLTRFGISWVENVAWESMCL